MTTGQRNERNGFTVHTTTQYVDRVMGAYVECALWCSTGDDGEPLDADYTVDDIAPEAIADMRNDVAAFCADNASDLDSIPADMVGHDFWLTRNRHGAGFWDRGYGALGDRLTEAAHVYGSSDLYVGDDGSLYVA